MKILDTNTEHRYALLHGVAVVTPIIDGIAQAARSIEKIETGECTDTLSASEEDYQYMSYEENLLPVFAAEIYKLERNDHRKDYTILWEKKDIQELIAKLNRLYTLMED